MQKCAFYKNYIKYFFSKHSFGKISQKAKKNNMLKSPKKIFESGRSMLEMLGVLALMGLLAATGFAGLGYVLDGWRSQEIQEAAAQTRALLVSTKSL